MGKTSLTLSTPSSLGALVSHAQTQILEERGLVSLLFLKMSFKNFLAVSQLVGSQFQDQGLNLQTL